MRRSELGAGRKSLDRGTTFANQGDGLKRGQGLERSTSSKPKPRAVSPASREQRAKVREAISIVSGEGPCDPAHLWPRGMGGCDDPLCVVPLTREEHRAFDAGALDLLPYLLAHGKWAELAHMVEAHQVDPIALLHRTTGDRYVPDGTGEDAVGAVERALNRAVGRLEAEFETLRLPAPRLRALTVLDIGGAS